MAAYVIVDVEVTDPELMGEYRKLVGPTLEQYGGRFLVRGGQYEVLEGDWRAQRVVVLEFDSVERAKQWHDSEEYREPKRMRQQAGKTNMIVVEGV